VTSSSDSHEKGADPTQAAAFPVRRHDDGIVQVCLIRRKDSTQWGIPKGNIEPGDDARRTALREADEEAGLEGRALGESIGAYEYEKNSLVHTVAVFVMEVLEERAEWPEMAWRERRWCTMDEAGALLQEHRAWPLFDRVRRSLSTR